MRLTVAIGGISLAAIWLRDNRDYPEALKIVEAFEKRYREEVRQQYRNREDESWLTRFRAAPVPFIAIWLAIGLILYLTLAPFMLG